jgi:hypothetical protein
MPHAFWDADKGMWVGREGPQRPSWRTNAEHAEMMIGRMEELVRKMAAMPDKSARPHGAAFAEARAIVAELEPVDHNEAVKVLAICGWVDDDASYDAAKDVAMEALKRGRELQKEGK